MINPADRVKNLGSGIFSQVDMLRQQVEKNNIKVINLGIGSPDGSPAEHIINALHTALENPNNYDYTLTHGTKEFRQAIADWYQKRFQVELDPDNEVLPLLGSQDGLSHIFLTYLNCGDMAIIPDPGYPVYSAGLALAEGELYPLPLLEENNYLPKFDEIPADISKKAKLMVLNYPNNPLAAVAEQDFFKEAVQYAASNQILLCHDFAYSELTFDGYSPTSILQQPDAKNWCVEFHSLSKSYNMAGCRIGFVVGNRQVIKNLGIVKSNIDFGVFKPIIAAGIAALSGCQENVKQNAKRYEERRDLLVDGLNKMGWPTTKPKATMFVWTKLPPGYTDSYEFFKLLLEKTGVLVIPGIAFGNRGEGYVRFALVEEKEILKEALDRINKANIINNR